MTNLLDSQVVAALGTIAGALITSLLGPSIHESIQSRRFVRQRIASSVPNILGEWSTSWYIGDEILHNGTVRLTKFVSRNGVVGEGQGRSSKGYLIYGEIDSSRVFVFTYRSKDYPLVGFVGAALLLLSIDGKKMTGKWIGRNTDSGLAENAVVTFTKVH